MRGGFVTFGRWQVAQRDEQRHWVSRLQDTVEPERGKERLKERAGEIERYVRGHGSFAERPVLEIGIAGMGEIGFLQYPGRYAFDRLALVFLRAFPQVCHGFPQLPATGECLSFAGQSFDVVIAVNLLDEALAPASVMREMTRVCRLGDTFARRNTFTGRLVGVSGGLLEKLWRTSGLPVLRTKDAHTISRAVLECLLRQPTLEPVGQSYTSWSDGRRHFRAASSFKVKALTGYGLFPIVVPRGLSKTLWRAAVWYLAHLKLG